MHRTRTVRADAADLNDGRAVRRRCLGGQLGDQRLNNGGSVKGEGGAGGERQQAGWVGEGSRAVSERLSHESIVRVSKHTRYRLDWERLRKRQDGTIHLREW